MIVVMETWHLKAGWEVRALEVMQRMDDVVGPPAHDHAGWCGHAHFYQSDDRRGDVIVVYPWRSYELHRDLVEREEPTLGDFYAQYCAAPREIRYYTELAVEVEHEHDAH